MSRISVLKKSFSFWVLPMCLMLSVAQGQISESLADSLRAQLTFRKHDSVKVAIYLALADGYKHTEPSTGLAYADTAYSLAKGINAIKWMATAEALRGIHYKLMGDFHQSIKCYLKTLDLSRSIHDTTGLVTNLSNISNLYLQIKDFQKSESYYLEALKLQKSTGNELITIVIYINLGALHINGTKDYDKAAEYLDKALAISERLGEKRFMIPCLINLSQVYYHQQRLGKSFELIGKAERLAQDISSKVSLVSIRLYYGRLYKAKEEYKQALQQLSRGLELAQTLNLKPEEKKITKEMAEIYALSNDFEKAYVQQEYFAQLNDSLNESQKKMILEHSEYNEASHQKKIEEGESVRQYLAKQKNKYLYGGVFFVALFMLVAWLVYRKKEKLAIQKQLIVRRNQDLSSKNVHLRKELEQLSQDLTKKNRQNQGAKESNAKKYNNSNLGEEEQKACMKGLLSLMDSEAPYLNPDLSLSTLAEAVSLSTHQLSELLNVCLEKNFYEFVNLYRVEALKEKLGNPKESHKKILALAYEVGFNSKTAFNNAFKKNTGLTPSAYRNKHLAEKVN